MCRPYHIRQHFIAWRRGLETRLRTVAACLILEVLLNRDEVLLGSGKVTGLEILCQLAEAEVRRGWVKAWAMGLLLCDDEVELDCSSRFCSGKIRLRRSRFPDCRSWPSCWNAC
jgi:hypothetical protein